MKRHVHTTNVLLQTDSEEIREQVQQSLKGDRYNLTVIPDGDDTLNILETNSYGVILLDMNLSDKKYLNLLASIKSNTHTQNTPVIIVCSTLDKEPILQGIEAGADDYVFPGLDLDLIEARISFTIERSHLQQEKMKGLLDISERIKRVVTFDPTPSDATNTMMNIEAFLHLVLTEIKGMYNADAGSVYYRENDTLRFVVVQTESLGVMLGGTTGNPITFSPVQLYKGDEKTPNYHNIASYVALTGETINIPNIYLTDQFDFSATKAFDANNNYQSISCLTVPLKGYRNDVIGVLQLLNACNDEGTIVPFDRAKQAITESLCVHVATILSNRLLIQQHTMMSKIENDLQIGRQIQSTFLPTKFPELPGWEIASYFHPAREVAGDFYDAFTMPGDRLGLVIADVCDKGVGAALFMSLMRSLIRAYAMQHYTIDWSKIMDTIAISARNVLAKKILPSAGSIALENAIKLTNQYVSSYHADLNMFATTFMGVLDPTKGSLLYINGGHCPPMHLDMEGNIKARLEATGPAVGMFQDAEFEISEVTLEPGDSLFMFTDGVTDVRNMEGRLFKEAGIMPLLQPPTSSIRELLNRVKDNIDNYMGDAVQFDDITMLGIRRDA